MEILTLMKGDMIGIVAPSRPIHNIKKEINAGTFLLQKNGYIVKFSKNINQKFFYSAGKINNRISDIHDMFRNKKVRAIISATGGASSSQLIEQLDYNLIRRNPKYFLGYSDITSLLIAINKKTGMPTFYGPNNYDMPNLSSSAKKFLFNILSYKNNDFKYPSSGTTWRTGQAHGSLVGGLLSRFSALLGTKFLPELKSKILFWEENNTSPAMIDFMLQQFRLAGVFDKIGGMIVGHLADCVDKKYPEDNRSIFDIVMERTGGYDFPILKVNYFGHDIKDFYTMPIGYDAWLDAEKKILLARRPS